MLPLWKFHKLLISQGRIEEVVQVGKAAAHVDDTLGGGGHRAAQGGAQGHQQLQALGHGHHARGHGKRVMATAACGDKQAVGTQVVGSHGYLVQVVDARRTAEIGLAKVTGIARGGQKPEDVEAQSESLKRR